MCREWYYHDTTQYVENNPRRGNPYKPKRSKEMTAGFLNTAQCSLDMVYQWGSSPDRLDRMGCIANLDQYDIWVYHGFHHALPAGTPTVCHGEWPFSIADPEVTRAPNRWARPKHLTHLTSVSQLAVPPPQTHICTCLYIRVSICIYIYIYSVHTHIYIYIYT